MGLDIYLYTKAEQLASEAREREDEEFYGGPDWPLYDSKTQEERDEFNASRVYKDYVFAASVDSRKYGKGTLNNRRYLRSSYNGTGFNNAVPNYVGYDARYEWMFEEVIDVDGGEYQKWLTETDIPELEKAMRRAAEVVVSLENLTTALNVTTVAPNPFLELPTMTDEQALSWAKEQLAKAQADPDNEFMQGGWSSREGNFYGIKHPLKVVALVPGLDWTGRAGAVHVVYEGPDDTITHYVQSAHIAGEFAEEAIDLIRQDGSAYVYWSG